MPARTVLPVYSPVSLKSVLAALVGADERDAIRRHLGALYGMDVLLVDSGTSALAGALRIAASLRPGRPAALPAYGCYDLITAAVAANCRVVLYDVNPQTMQPDGSSLARALKSRPSSVVVVHHYGIPVNMEDVLAQASANDTVVIEDAAQGDGGMWNDRPLGAWGDLSVLSFGRGKGLTGGRGGALLIRSDAADMARRVNDIFQSPKSTAVRDAAALLAQYVLGRPSLYWVPSLVPSLGLGQTMYRDHGPLRIMTGATARTLRCSIQAIEDERLARRRHANRIHESLRDLSWRAPSLMADAVAGWLRYPILGSASGLARRKAARLGISPGYPRALHLLPQAAPILESSGPLNGACEIVASAWTLPTHSQLTASDLARLEEWLETSVPSR